MKPKENLDQLHDAVLADLLAQHPLPAVKVKTNIKAGTSSDNIMWTVKFRNGS